MRRTSFAGRTAAAQGSDPQSVTCGQITRLCTRAAESTQQLESDLHAQLELKLAGVCWQRGAGVWMLDGRPFRLVPCLALLPLLSPRVEGGGNGPATALIGWGHGLTA